MVFAVVVLVDPVGGVEFKGLSLPGLPPNENPTAIPTTHSKSTKRDPVSDSVNLNDFFFFFFLLSFSSRLLLLYIVKN